MAANLHKNPSERMAPNALMPGLFNIFSELEKDPTNKNEIMNATDFRNLASYVKDGKKFINKLKNDIFIENVQLNMKIKKNKNLIVSIKKRKTQTSSPAVKKYLKEMLKSQGKIQILKNRLKKINHYEMLYGDFVRRIEDADSPQQIDLYVASIEDEQNKLMGNPPKNKSPVALKKLIRFLQAKESEAKAKEQLAQSKKGALIAAITSPKARLPLKILATYLPNELERWAHEGIDSAQLREAVEEAQKQHDIAYQNIVDSKDTAARLLFLNKIKVLDEMISYAETSKHNFDRRLNFSSAMHTAATVCSMLSTTVSGVLTFIPGANLIAEGFKKTFEFLGYSSLVAAQATDPNVSMEDDLAARRHYEAMKEYNFIETIFAGFGTLSLATAAILPAVVTLAFPLAPALLCLGAANMMISNVISSYSSYKDYTRTQEVLQKNDLYPRLGELRIRAKQGDKTLSKAEKSIVRDDLHSKEVLAKFKSRASSSIGTGMFAVLAGAALAAAIGFPPFGALVATVLTVATVATAVYSVYQRHQEKKRGKAAYKMNEEIQSHEIRTALDTIKPDLSSKRKSGIKPSAKAELSSSLDRRFQENVHTSDSPKAAETVPNTAILHAAKLTTGEKIEGEQSRPSLGDKAELLREKPQAILQTESSTQDINVPEITTQPKMDSSETQSQPEPDRAPPVPARPKNKHNLLERHKMMLKNKDKQSVQSTDNFHKPSLDGSKHNK